MDCNVKPAPRCLRGPSNSVPLALLSLCFVFASQRAHAETVDCSAISVLEGPGLQKVAFAVPTASSKSTIFLLLEAGYGPMALEAERLGDTRAQVLLPAPFDEAGSQIEATLLAIGDDDSIEWVCDEIETRLLPLAAHPGGTDRFATYLGDLSDQFWPGLALTADDGKLAQLSDMFAEMRTEITELADGLSDDGLAQTDAFLGTYLGALKDTDPPTVAVSAAPANSALALFAAAPPPEAAGVSGTIRKALLNACPADPQELTEYIQLGTKARAHTGAAAQFYLTTGLTLAGVSARLLNKAYFRNETADKVIEKSVATVNAVQGLLGDYLTGMMPLNLDSLDITHTGSFFYDDTPPDARQVVVTGAQLRTSSDGWSMDKLALDTLLGAAGLRSGAPPSGPVSDAVLGQAQRNATRLERIAQTVEAQFGTNLAVTNQVRNTVRRHANAAQTELEAMQMGVETVQGTLQGQVTGQATGAVGNSDLGPLGKKISRCQLDLAKPEDGSRPKHVFLTMEGGNNAVAIPAFEPPLALDIVGTGRATALVQLNPSTSTFPIPQARSLPEASFEVEVARLKIGIEGPGPQVQAGQVLDFVATTEGVRDSPRLIWSVSPVMLMQASGDFSEQVRLSVPADLPDGTVITLTATALGDFISAAEQAPQTSVALQIKEEDSENVSTTSCGQMMQNLERPKTLSSGQTLAGNWQRLSSALLAWGNINSANCRQFQSYQSHEGQVFEIPSDPGGLAWVFAPDPWPLGKISKDVFIAALQGNVSYSPAIFSCYAPPGYVSLKHWLDRPEVEVFVYGSPNEQVCSSYVVTDGTFTMVHGDLAVDWSASLFQRE